MKSEKAKEALRALTLNKPNIDHCIAMNVVNGTLHSDIERIVDLAEQEAEERMRRKAFSAFDDMWFENGEDGEFEPDYEYHRRNFVQKLSEG